jgi:hypothetical protein
MVDAPAARLGQRVLRDDVQKRVVAEIEPGTEKAEERPVAFVSPKTGR